MCLSRGLSLCVVFFCVCTVYTQWNEIAAKINYSGDNNIDRRHTLDSHAFFRSLVSFFNCLTLFSAFLCLVCESNFFAVAFQFFCALCFTFILVVLVFFFKRTFALFTFIWRRWLFMLGKMLMTFTWTKKKRAS